MDKGWGAARYTDYQTSGKKKVKSVVENLPKE